ncbi:transmembrane protease serine 9-like [Chrysoperla carnea]|uniref:transmembrane protease serine 9-like n=1 Tax=Chrysoperla carnea TaxID=189513 RepID=UPI001D073054|nr:transmembrane protease serine 9-like [Chrysoperla carnea]
MINSKATKVIKIDTREGISRGLCLRYAKSVYVLEYPAFNVPGAAPKNVSQCHVNHRPLIYGGSKAKGKEFPHMALIGYAKEDDIKWMCGGSLITEEWVLTAAHCAYTTYGEAKFVRLGELDFADDNDDSEPQNFDVIQIEEHPEHGISHYNDIALLKLNKKAKLTAYVRPACLWTKHDIKNSKAIATGWGLTGWIPFFHNRSSHLLQVTLSLVPQSICNQTIFNAHRLNKGIIDEMQICAGVGENDKDKKDTCQGDSGGPLQIFANDVECMYYIIGVTSFGKPCGKTRAAGVYTRVSNYIPWIESTITSKSQACTHRRSGSPGTCKVLDNCDEAVSDLFDRDINPQICSWKKNVQVVCCRNTEPVKPNKTSEVKIDTRNGISRGLCLYYASTVFTIKNPPFNVPGAVPKNISLCGVKYRPLIYGGTLAGGKEFPHMALIGYGEDEDNIDWSCGGSLITEEWVMTAAHCAYTINGDAKYVRLGDLDYADDNDDASPQDFKIVQIEKHPDHSTSHYNDIALLKLNKKAEINAYVRPACLWTKREVEAKNNRALVTGWGTTKFFGVKSSQLLQAALSIIPHSECNSTYQKEERLNQGVLDDMQLCAGAAPNESNKDTCQGDSGGPLQIFAEDVHCMYYIIGVTSFGKPCGYTRIPGVYTRVSNYIPWIEKTVWKN